MAHSDHQGVPQVQYARIGPIVYMGSVHSKEASPLMAAYVTAKHGILGRRGWCEGRRAAQCPRNVYAGLRTNAIGRKADPPTGQELRHQRSRRRQNVMLKGTVDGQFTTHEETPRPVLYFAGARTNALTGILSLVVSHGWFME